MGELLKIAAFLGGSNRSNMDDKNGCSFYILPPVFVFNTGFDTCLVRVILLGDDCIDDILIKLTVLCSNVDV